MAVLRSSRGDRARLASARSAVLLVGGYDGSGNYGDVLQLAAAIEMVRLLPGGPLPIVVVEREMLDHHRHLVARYPELLGPAAFAFYGDGSGQPLADLVALGPGDAPRRSVLHLYGGGYLNGWWAERKVEHAAAAERLVGEGCPVTASGLQVEGQTIAPGTASHSLLARARWIGVRDGRSLAAVRDTLRGPAADSAALVGDDALPCLWSSGPREAVPDAGSSSTVNLHLNAGSWVSDDTAGLMDRIADLVVRLGDAWGDSLEVRPVVAYEDPRVSEREVIAAFLDRHGDRLARHGLTLASPLDLLDSAASEGLASFRRARLTVGCSYHVTLTSLLAGIPAVLFADNGYYDQKAEGLRELFQVDARLVGAQEAASAAAAASSLLREGTERASAVARLHARAHTVAGRQRAGCEQLSAVLADALRPSVSERLLGQGRSLRAAVRRRVGSFA